MIFFWSIHSRSRVFHWSYVNNFKLSSNLTYFFSFKPIKPQPNLVSSLQLCINSLIRSFLSFLTFADQPYSFFSIAMPNLSRITINLHLMHFFLLITQLKLTFSFISMPFDIAFTLCILHFIVFRLS